MKPEEYEGEQIGVEMSEEKLRLLARTICEQLRPQGADGWHDRIEVDNEFCLFCGVVVELLRPALREATKAGREAMRGEAAEMVRHWGECGDCGGAATLHDVAEKIRALPLEER